MYITDTQRHIHKDITKEYAMKDQRMSLFRNAVTNFANPGSVGLRQLDSWD